MAILFASLPFPRYLSPRANFQRRFFMLTVQQNKSVLTMSSRELSKLTDKRHDNTLKNIFTHNLTPPVLFICLLIDRFFFAFASDSLIASFSSHPFSRFSISVAAITLRIRSSSGVHHSTNSRADFQKSSRGTLLGCLAINTPFY